MVTDEALGRARDRFYPGWWIYEGSHTAEALKPLYKVACQSLADTWMAKSVKPEGVRADIVYSPTPR